MIQYLLLGVPITIEVSVFALALAVVSALVLALGRMSPFWFIRWPAGFVIEFMRGTSALVQLFWVFYVLPLFGITLSPMMAGIIVLGLNEGSYFSEVVRASLGSVMRGQRDAITALHLPRGYAFFRITIPQALPLMVPSFGNAAVGMLKFSSLVSLVTLQDVTFRTHALHASSGDSLTVYLAAMAIYFALALFTIGAVHQLERYINRKAGRFVNAKHSFFRSEPNAIPQWAFGK